MKLKLSGNILLISFSCVLYISTLVVFCFWDYNYQKNYMIRNIDDRLYQNAATLKLMFPDDLHDRAVDKQAISVEEDINLANKLTRFAKASGLKYAYTIIKQNGSLYFVLADLVADPKTERGTYYFYLYEEADKSFYAAFENLEPISKTVSDQWGIVRTAIVPQISPGGTKYLLCVDYDIEYVNDILNKNWLRTGSIILFFLFLTLPIIFVYTRLHKSNIRSLKRSEERYRSIFENSIEGFFQSTPEGQFISVNPAFAQMLGYSSPEELVELISDISTQNYDNIKDRMRFMQILEKDGLVEKFEFKAKRKDGTVVWLSSSTRAIVDRTGEVVRYEGNIEDISNRKQTEAEMRRLNHLQETIIDNASIWLNVVDPDGNVLVWNKAAESISGYSKEEVIGHNIIWEWCYPDLEYRSQILEKATEITEGKEVLEDFETTICAKNKEERQISWYSRNLIDDDGVVIGSLALGRDVTNYRLAKEALKKSEEQLARSKKMESLGLLAGGVAHDLNNVLSGIVSYPELILLDLPEDSKYRKPVKTIMESGNKAAAIVQDLLTIARGVAVKKQTLNLNDIVSEYLSSPELSKLVSYHPKVSFKKNLESTPLHIHGSKVHLNKIVMNIVSNAVEAIDDQGTVVLSTRNCCIDIPVNGYENIPVGEYVVFSASDDGPGISNVDIDHIFEPFYSKKEMNRSGTGLGLAVVWNIVHDHDGYIDIETGNDRTTFEVFLPMSHGKQSNELVTVPFNQYKANGETVLVVDDVLNQREISCKMLETLEYKCAAVSSGEEALEYLKNNTVDLVLLDMIMDPGINGRETYERISKLYPKQKSIIVSGFAETEDVQEAQRLGAGQYIKKPFSLKELGQALREEMDKN